MRFHLRDALADTPLDAVAAALVGAPAADIELTLRRAKAAARRARRPLALDDIFAASPAGMMGAHGEMERVVAAHEAGHALAQIRLAPTERATITMAGRMVVQPGPPRPRTLAYLEDEMVIYLAGRAAEAVLLGAPTTGSGGGATSDLARAYKLASEALVGAGFSTDHPLLYLPEDGREAMPMTPVWDEMRRWVERAYGRALDLCQAERHTLALLAEALIKRRALTHADMCAIIAAGEQSQSTRLLTVANAD